MYSQQPHQTEHYASALGYAAGYADAMRHQVTAVIYPDQLHPQKGKPCSDIDEFIDTQSYIPDIRKEECGSSEFLTGKECGKSSDNSAVAAAQQEQVSDIDKLKRMDPFVHVNYGQQQMFAASQMSCYNAGPLRPPMPGVKQNYRMGQCGNLNMQHSSVPTIPLQQFNPRHVTPQQNYRFPTGLYPNQHAVVQQKECDQWGRPVANNNTLPPNQHYQSHSVSPPYQQYHQQSRIPPSDNHHQNRIPPSNNHPQNGIPPSNNHPQNGIPPSNNHHQRVTPPPHSQYYHQNNIPSQHQMMQYRSELPPSYMHGTPGDSRIHYPAPHVPNMHPSPEYPQQQKSHSPPSSIYNRPYAPQVSPISSCSQSGTPQKAKTANVSQAPQGNNQIVDHSNRHNNTQEMQPALRNPPPLLPIKAAYYIKSERDVQQEFNSALDDLFMTESSGNTHESDDEDMSLVMAVSGHTKLDIKPTLQAADVKPPTTAQATISSPSSVHGPLLPNPDNLIERRKEIQNISIQILHKLLYLKETTKCKKCLECVHDAESKYRINATKFSNWYESKSRAVVNEVERSNLNCHYLTQTRKLLGRFLSKFNSDADKVHIGAHICNFNSTTLKDARMNIPPPLIHSSNCKPYPSHLKMPPLILSKGKLQPTVVPELPHTDVNNHGEYFSGFAATASDTEQCKTVPCFEEGAINKAGSRRRKQHFGDDNPSPPKICRQKDKQNQSTCSQEVLLSEEVELKGYVYSAPESSSGMQENLDIDYYISANSSSSGLGNCNNNNSFNEDDLDLGNGGQIVEDMNTKSICSTTLDMTVNSTASVSDEPNLNHISDSNTNSNDHQSVLDRTKFVLNKYIQDGNVNLGKKTLTMIADKAGLPFKTVKQLHVLCTVGKS